jgi:two-component system LytT family response regulator
MKTTPSRPTGSPRLIPAAAPMLGVGFLYWLVFLLSLEPDNVARALQAGASLKWSQEAVRILAASLLGCAATPLFMEQVRRFPIEGRYWRRHAVLQAFGAVTLAAGLIAMSCVLANWFLVTEHRPFDLALREELIANGPLVAFCIATFLGLAHAVRFFEQARAEPARPMAQSSGYMTIIPVRARGGMTLVPVAQIDWIETQGNYLALHVNGESHLIRESLARLEARLDPAHFLRVHRQTMVAADRIAAMTSLGAGDAQLLSERRLDAAAQPHLSRSPRKGGAGAGVLRPGDGQIRWPASPKRLNQR